MIQIRFGKKDDINLILNGILEICKIEKQKPETKNKLIQQTKNAIQKKEIRIITLNKEPIGFLQYKFTKKTPYGIDYGNSENKFCWIDWFYITKEHRRKGFGEILIKDLKLLSKKKKIHEIMLDVFNINNQAIKFYKKEVFKDFIQILKIKN